MFDRILLAIDGSEPARRATDVAGNLASKIGGEVIVVHVIEGMLSRAGAYESETGEQAAELVDETVRKLKNSGVSARGEVHRTLYGRAAREILEVAEAADAGLVVMGSRGLSDLAGLVMGSVTHKILHLARVPVLVVR